MDDAHGILQELKPWLKHEGVLKLWHNYGFNRHELYSKGILTQGFDGDIIPCTWNDCLIPYNTSRMKLVLESLSEDFLGGHKVPIQKAYYKSLSYCLGTEYY